MPTALAALEDPPRLLMQAKLKPVQGTRFQPTGFPDLGPAEYERPDETRMLLVESAQSMANRLEAVCWDEGRDELVESLAGLPYVSVALNDERGGELGMTSSILEFHRLNSPYICGGSADGGGPFRDTLASELGLKQARKTKQERSEADEGEGEEVPGVLNLRRLARVAFKYDPSSVVHGLFLEKIAGRLRLTRALSGFIEAENVRAAPSGGVKFDRVLPRPKDLELDAKEGYGNVPFHRTEYVAERITAYFNLDLALLRSYGLPKAAVDLLVALSLWKVRRFLTVGLRLRANCDLELNDGADIEVTAPKSLAGLPAATDLQALVTKSIDACRKEGCFANPPITRLTWRAPAKKKEKEAKGS